MVDIEDQLADEFDNVLDSVKQDLIEPTADERRNGWTAETLTAYLAERKASAEVNVDPHSMARRLKRRPRQQNTRYNPHRWRE